MNAGDNCYARSGCYKNVCLLCKEIGKKKEYIGETSLSGYERANCHVDEGERRKTTSHINQHLTEYHPECRNIRAAFGTRIVNNYKTAFLREIGEVILQRAFTGDILMNNKLEFMHVTSQR